MVGFARFAIAQEAGVGPAAVQYESNIAKIAAELFGRTAGIRPRNIRQQVLIRDFAGRNPNSNRADSHDMRPTGSDALMKMSHTGTNESKGRPTGEVPIEDIQQL